MAGTLNSSLSENIKNLLNLLLTDLRLTATEKLSKLITTFAIVFIIGLLGLGVLLFLSYSMAAFFSTLMPEGFACMIVAGVYLLFIIIVIVFRRTLLETPVTKLMSKIILSEPLHKSNIHKSIQNKDNETLTR